MAKQVIKDAYIVLNGSNLSDHVDSVTLTFTDDAVESTGMGTGGGRERIQGLSDDTLELDVQQDLALSSVNAVLGPLQSNGSEFSIEVRMTSSAVSTTNPKWTATGILFEYVPIDGKVGDLSTTKIKINTQREGFVQAFA